MADLCKFRRNWTDQHEVGKTTGWRKAGRGDLPRALGPGETGGRYWWDGDVQTPREYKFIHTKLENVSVDTVEGEDGFLLVNNVAHSRRRAGQFI